MVEASWSTMVGMLTSHKRDPMCKIFCLRTAGFVLAGWHPEGLSDYDSVTVPRLLMMICSNISFSSRGTGIGFLMSKLEIMF